MNQTIKIRKIDKKRYVFNDKRDYEILSKIYRLEKLVLRKQDRLFVKFARTQLKKDWRNPLLESLNNLLKNYKQSDKLN